MLTFSQSESTRLLSSPKVYSHCASEMAPRQTLIFEGRPPHIQIRKKTIKSGATQVISHKGREKPTQSTTRYNTPGLGTQGGVTPEPKHSHEGIRHPRKGRRMPSPQPCRAQNKSVAAKIPSTKRRKPATETVSARTTQKKTRPLTEGKDMCGGELDPATSTPETEPQTQRSP